jgi:uncharacterized protein YuzE
MKLHYYAATNSLYIDLSEKASVESREVSPGVVLDFDEGGHLCGIDVDHASQNLDLSRLETISLPVEMAYLTPT